MPRNFPVWVIEDGAHAGGEAEGTGAGDGVGKIHDRFHLGDADVGFIAAGFAEDSDGEDFLAEFGGERVSPGSKTGASMGFVEFEEGEEAVVGASEEGGGDGGEVFQGEADLDVLDPFLGVGFGDEAAGDEDDAFLADENALAGFLAGRRFRCAGCIRR